MDEKEKKEQLQRKYIELQTLDQHIKLIQDQLQTMENQIMELIYTIQSLDDLKNIRKNSEIFVPVSSGIFTKAEIKENKKLLVNIGANIVIEKEPDDIKKMLEKQVEEIKQLQLKSLNELNKLASRAGSIETEINKITSGQSYNNK
jgi:prefoldin alpha subunit